jgi:hypothetical protein
MAADSRAQPSRAPLVVSILSMIVSSISMGVAVRSCTLTEKYQAFEHRQLIRVNNANSSFVDPPSSTPDLAGPAFMLPHRIKQAFTFTGELKNYGEPVQIRTVAIMCEDENTGQKGYINLEGDFILGDDAHPIEFRNADQFTDADFFDFENVALSLLIQYVDVEGEVRSLVKPIGGYRGTSPVLNHTVRVIDRLEPIERLE